MAQLSKSARQLVKRVAVVGAVKAHKPGVGPKRAADTVARIYDEIRRLVVRFEIPPDERIKEVDLAARLRVSRTPVREALNRLVTEGLLIFEPNRGFRCRSFDTKEMMDLYEARQVLEVGAVRLAAKRAGDDEIRDLVRFWEDVAASQSRPVTALVRHDEEFHERLVGLSGNAELVRTLKSINARIHFARWMDLEREERRTKTYSEHMQILAALQARDQDKCARTLGAHIERRREQIVDVMKAGVVKLYYR
jgi:DNA-binding GntR family transcriptional regulator